MVCVCASVRTCMFWCRGLEKGLGSRQGRQEGARKQGRQLSRQCVHECVCVFVRMCLAQGPVRFLGQSDNIVT